MERRKLRVVFDSNILIAAYNWPGGKAEGAYLLARLEIVGLHVSLFILGEVERVLGDKFGWEAERIVRAIAQIRRVAGSVHETTESVHEISNDPTDNKVLECALAAEADVMVTGDKKHLLPLGTFRGTDIVGLQEFLGRFPAE